MEFITRLFCKADPLVSLLHQHLDAQILRLPQERMKPFAVLEYSHGQAAKYRGHLSTFISEATGIGVNEKKFLTESFAAPLSDERSTATESSFGLDVADGFLKGFGVSAPGLKAQFKDVSKVSFSFANVYQIIADNGLLSQELEGKHIRLSLPAASGFRQGKRLLLVDSAWTSSNFTIHVEEKTDDAASLDAEALEAVASGLSVKVRKESSGLQSITFEREKPLPFAFTAIELEFDGDGLITGMPPFDKRIDRVFANTKSNLRKTKLTEFPALIDIEMD